MDAGFDMDLLQEDYVEVSLYSTDSLTVYDTISENVRNESALDISD